MHMHKFNLLSQADQGRSHTRHKTENKNIEQDKDVLDVDVRMHWPRWNSSLPASQMSTNNLRYQIRLHLLSKHQYDFQFVSLRSKIIYYFLMLPMLIKSYFKRSNIRLLAATTQFGKLFQWSTARSVK